MRDPGSRSRRNRSNEFANIGNFGTEMIKKSITELTLLSITEAGTLEELLPLSSLLMVWNNIWGYFDYCQLSERNTETWQVQSLPYIQVSGLSKLGDAHSGQRYATYAPAYDKLAWVSHWMRQIWQHWPGRGPVGVWTCVFWCFQMSISSGKMR